MTAGEGPTSHCPFCAIVAGKAPASVVAEDDETLAFVDRDPRAPTHVLVIPKRHLEHLGELTLDDGPLLARLVRTAQQAAHDAGLEERGYRIVCNVGSDAGMSVHHLHLHLLGGRRLAWPPG